MSKKRYKKTRRNTNTYSKNNSVNNVINENVMAENSDEEILTEIVDPVIELKNALMDAYLNTDLPVSEVQKSLGISSKRMYTLLHEIYGNDLPERKYKRKNTKKVEDEKPSSTLFSFTNQYFEIPNLVNIEKPGTIVECGLVGERHNIYNIEEYIFEKTLTDDELSDFELQYNTAYNYISDHVSEKDTMILYCTGIQSVLAATIKAAFDLKRNLVLKHLNPNTRSYESQIMWDFGNIHVCTFPFTKMENPMMFKTSLDDILNISDVYAINLGTVDPNTYDVKEKRTIITTTISDAWELYTKFVEVIKEKDVVTYNSVQLSYITITSNAFRWGDKISESYNYSRADKYN